MIPLICTYTNIDLFFFEKPVKQTMEQSFLHQNQYIIDDFLIFIEKDKLILNRSIITGENFIILYLLY